MPGSGRQRRTRARWDGGVTPFCEQVRTLARNDRDRFTQNFLWIKTKEAGFERLKFRKGQQEVRNLRREDREAGIPVRHQYLKSRQVGFSTDSAADTFTCVWANNNTDALIIAHDKPRAADLLSKSHLFHKSLPESLQLPLERSTTERIRFRDTNSGMAIMTAANYQSSRGGTQQIAHLSEVPLYVDPLAVIGGVEHTMPYTPNTQIILEYTAFGAGTPMHQFWLAGKAGENQYKAHFSEWMNDPECMLPPFRSDQAEAEFIEQMLFEYPDLEGRAEQYALSNRQVGWWYLMLKNKCFGDWLLCQQEYPCDDDEAWISSGNPIFDLRHLGRFRDKCRKGTLYNPKDGQVNVVHQLDQYKKVEEGEIDRGSDVYIEVWQPALSGRRYLIGADAAAGYLESDFSSAFVIDMVTLEMCAEFHGRIEPDEFAKVLASLGFIYNNAIIAPETDGVGLATLACLQQFYFNIYAWRMIDAYGLKISNRLGWSTNIQSRPIMVTNCKRLFRERAHMPESMGAFIKSRALIDEMRTFVVTGMTGKPEAASGCHDDRVMAWMIALICTLQEMYGMVADDNTLLPVPTKDITSMKLAPKMEQVVDSIMEGPRGWAKSDFLEQDDW